MRLTKYEQEMIINFNEEEATAEVYTHNPVLKRRLKMMAARYPEDVQLVKKARLGAMTYRVAKWLVHISLPKSSAWKAAQSARARDNGCTDHFIRSETDAHCN